MVKNKQTHGQSQNQSGDEIIEYIEFSFLSILVNKMDTELFLKAYEKIDADDFINSDNKKIYFSISNLVIKRNLKIDKALIINELKDADLIEKFETISKLNVEIDNFNHYIEEIKNASRLRKVKSIVLNYSVELQNTQPSGVIELISSLEDDLLKINTSNKLEVFTPQELIFTYLKDIKADKKPNVTSTGFPSLDEILNGGLQPNLYLLAARPSVGKTEMMLNIASKIARQNKEVLIFSLEMDEEQLMKRIIAEITEIPLRDIITGNLSSQQMVKLEAAIDTIGSLPIYIDTSNISTAQQIAAKAKRMKIKHPELKLIAIDYLQLISSANKRETENAELTEISRILKGISRTLKIPVLALSQLSRNVEHRDNKRPILSDLRGSGSLEMDADVIMFMYNEEYYDKSKSNCDTEIIVSKHRNGPLGTIFVTGDKNIQKFYDTGR